MSIETTQINRTKKYEFYYETSEGVEQVMETKECIKPQSTKVYRFLEEKLHDNHISLFGFRLVDSN